MQARRTRPAAVTADEVLTVHSSSLGETRKVISVRRFATDPAFVRVNKGFTSNMGNYESLRIDVSITVPCYVEEIDAVIVDAADKAHEAVTDEFKKHGIEV